MAPLAVNDPFPEDVVFSYVPPSPETEDITACGLPQNYEASKEFKTKKVVIVAVPGAFTPTCQADHLPGYIKNIEAFKAKGFDNIIVVAFNDAWVMDAWRKANNYNGEFILFASDAGAKFSHSISWVLGERTARYAIVVDNGRVTFAEKEPAGGVTVSGAKHVLDHC